jgi:hypothetical protein
MPDAEAEHDVRRISTWVAALVALAVVAALLVRFSSDEAEANLGPVPPGVVVNASALRSARTDAGSVAAVERALATAHHPLVGVSRPTGAMSLAGRRVTLTPGNRAVVWLDRSRRSFCVVVTAPAGATAVYVSDRGGVQPGAARTCPVGFATR